MATKRILIFNVNWLGDVLFSTATIRNIRYNFPDAIIACVIPPRCYPVLKGNPHLDEIIIFDEKVKHSGFWGKIAFIRSLKAGKFSLVFLLHRSLTRALICYLAGIPERIGYDTKKLGFLLTKRITPADRDRVHRIDYYLNIIQKAGFKAEDRYTEFFINEEDNKFIEYFTNKNGIKREDFLIGVNPGGNWLPKRWPKESWVVLIERLIKESHAKVVVTGGPEDRGLVMDIQAQLSSEPIIACGLLSLKQLAALFKRLDCFISADSGPLHIANAIGSKKIIGLFGPTSPLITGPNPGASTIIIKKDIGCRTPCYEVDCPDNRCMKVITVDDVIEQVKNTKV
ncbi:MAG: lipopolysaccharide heptosyltransferase II [Candidatus Omnitrophota bacterium]|nr:lipopolysaccharide heptosyltransferase II [Candidatus Omnitrophota bacterium]MBU1929304.1 lipopolysaccharide heptosyltransferase II [Candidatus Omnitrophota bacterium]MBU2035596.1 lipopolysaccharide heptosyltransferase II [Candidatus Omnitrophota bacterium]MBU2222002.1 lipopolysaccharide heptosyltransferase II [Candidatus Omnitrophota bacterium]MBU2258019.1 lipopolysaccharide heptosyltransferase II [Candidatus Omnitrophota bacterium]